MSNVVAMIKENGEAGHVSVRVIDNKFYFIAGSKNVHLIFHSAADLELYTDQRFLTARKVGLAWLDQLEKMSPDKIPLLLSFLHESRQVILYNGWTLDRKVHFKDEILK